MPSLPAVEPARAERADAVPAPRGPRLGLVRQKPGRDQWIRRVLLVLTAAWLLCAVALPMAAVVDRVVRAEVSVVVDGASEIRVGGREAAVEGDAVRFGEYTAPVVEGAAEAEQFQALVENGKFEKVSVHELEVGRQVRRIKPIVVEWRPEGVRIDGEALPEGLTATTVRRYIGAARFVEYFSNPSLYQSLYNSLFVAFTSTALALTIAFVYAYALTRASIPGAGLFRIIAMAPIFAPTMMYGLSLVYLFGNRGIFTTGFFGHAPWLQFDIDLYGPVGIVLAETVFIFPPALVILLIAFSNTDARLYEAASSLGASPLRTFLTVTVPGVKFGLVNAAFVCFTLAFTDFGAPKVVGGDYNVLAVDIYKQVIGQQNFGMAATVSIVLLIPAAVAFVIERIIQRRTSSAISERSVALVVKPSPWRDRMLFAFCLAAAGFILLMVFTAGFASLVRTWPYDFSLSLRHYSFEGVNAGYGVFWNSIRIALYTAAIGTAVTFVGAYLIVKSRSLGFLRQSAHVLSIIPLALPGLVIGIAYIFFFNTPEWPLPLGLSAPNPFAFLYQTMAILVLANIVHFYTVSYLTASTALRQLDSAFEAVSESMGAPFYKTFFRVTVPVCTPALLEIASFYFVNAMATVSAVIFLYGPETRPASVAVVNLDDAGDTAAAAALCMLIVLGSLAGRGILDAARVVAARRMEGWRQR